MDLWVYGHTTMDKVDWDPDGCLWDSPAKDSKAGLYQYSVKLGRNVLLSSKDWSRFVFRIYVFALEKPMEQEINKNDSLVGDAGKKLSQ